MRSSFRKTLSPKQLAHTSKVNRVRISRGWRFGISFGILGGLLDDKEKANQNGNWSKSRTEPTKIHIVFFLYTNRLCDSVGFKYERKYGESRGVSMICRDVHFCHTSGILLIRFAKVVSPLDKKRHFSKSSRNKTNSCTCNEHILTEYFGPTIISQTWGSKKAADSSPAKIKVSPKTNLTWKQRWKGAIPSVGSVDWLGESGR